jgi:hypothetical protein
MIKDNAKVVTRVTNAAGRPFNVRLVCRGGRYGLNDCLVHDEDDPLVEFWDATAEDDPRFTRGRGQFVSRYYLSTLTSKRILSSELVGLDLCSHVPAWQVTGNNVVEAIAAVEAALRDDDPAEDVDPAKVDREDRERAMFGCTAVALDEILANRDPRDVAMYVMGVLSDAQELIRRNEREGTATWSIDDRHANTIRQLLNVAKYAIDKAVPR